MSIYIGTQLLSGSTPVGGNVTNVTNIQSADGDNAISVSADGIPSLTLARDTTEQVRFWSGTGAEYDALGATRDQNTVYYVTDR